MGGLVLKSVDEDVCFHPDYDKRGIQCFDEVKSIVVHIIKISLFISSHTCWGAPSYSAVSSWYLGSSSFCHLFDNRALSQMLSLPGWFLFMYSFIVGPQVTVCRRIVHKFIGSQQIWCHTGKLPFRHVLKLCGTSTLFCSWKTCHTNCKGIQFLCGHHGCGHWEGFHLKIAYHKSCTQVQNSFFWNMLRFVATRLAGCHRLTLKSWKNFVFEDRKIPDK